MEETNQIVDYRLRFDKLKEIIESTNKHIINDSESLICENVNFYIKTYLIMQCVYLESYIKEVLLFYVGEINRQIENIKVPYNLVKWSFSISSLLKDKDKKDSIYKIEMSIKDIDQHISANPYRTKELLVHFGIDMSENENFNQLLEKINSIVTRRNNIVHYNDDASDVSPNDLIVNINIIKDYMNIIDNAICSKLVKYKA